MFVDFYICIGVPLSIYSNYIPKKTVLCDDKDPPWMSDGI